MILAALTANNEIYLLPPDAIFDSLDWRDRSTHFFFIFPLHYLFWGTYPLLPNNKMTRQECVSLKKLETNYQIWKLVFWGGNIKIIL